MMGWWIVIAHLSPDGISADATDAGPTILATWETSVSGIDWLKTLSKEGRAEHTSRDGYPHRFMAMARDVLPLIAAGPPVHRGPEITGDDYVMPGNWTGKVTLFQDRIAACQPDQILTIEAWDQS